MFINRDCPIPILMKSGSLVVMFWTVFYNGIFNGPHVSFTALMLPGAVPAGLQLPRYVLPKSEPVEEYNRSAPG